MVNCSRLRTMQAQQFDEEEIRSQANSWITDRRLLMSTILVVILVLLLVGALPAWPYSRSWGYYPSSGLGIVVVILLVLLLAGRL